MAVLTQRLPWKEWREKGLVPPEIRRMVIDSEVDQPVRVYYETWGSEQQLNELIPSMLKEAVESKLVPIDKKPVAQMSDEEIATNIRKCFGVDEAQVP